MSIKEDLGRLIDGLPESELYAAWRYLNYLKHTADPLLKKLLEAPEDDEELTPKGVAAIEEGWEALRRGDIVSDEELSRELGL